MTDVYSGSPAAVTIDGSASVVTVLIAEQGPVGPAAADSLTADELAAIQGASDPSAENPFATLGDVSSGGDHGALSGLADDDHTQYHTDARGDARYLQSSAAGGAAYLDVGTAAGTVAAGDDSRFTAITAVGSGVNFFPTDTAIVPAGVDNTYPIKTLSHDPTGAAEDVDAIVIPAGTTVMYGTYRFPTALLNTALDGGIWEFHVYAGVDSATGVTQLIQNVYRVRPAAGTVTITGTGTSRTATASTDAPFATSVIDASAAIADCSFVATPLGLYPITARTSDTVVTITTPSGYANETAVAFDVHKKLFGVTSGEINTLAGAGPAYAGIALLPEMLSTQADFPLVTGDTIATAFLGTSTSNRTLYFAHDGTTRYSHFHSPIHVITDLATGVSGVLAVANGGTGGTSLPKLDALSTPDDVTTLNASTSRHGLAPKASAPASASLINYLGIGNGQTGWIGKQLFDSGDPAALGTAATGSSLIAARRDHVHTLPALDALAAATDIETANATTSAHGLLLKATAPASGLLNVVGIANGETVYANKALFDNTNPAALGTAAPGTSLIAARRDHVHPAPASGYELTFQVPVLAAPASATTYYFGNSSVAPCGSCDGRGKIYILKAGTLTIADVFSYSTTAGSNEAWAVSVRLNGTTNTEIASVSASTNDRRWSNSALSIAVAAGDYVEFITTTPTWGTPPANTRFNGVVWIAT